MIGVGGEVEFVFTIKLCQFFFVIKAALITYETDSLFVETTKSINVE